MMRTGWIVKLTRYDGSTSVMTKPTTQEDAEKTADMLNKHEQTGNYTVEPWVNPLVKRFIP